MPSLRPLVDMKFSAAAAAAWPASEVSRLMSERLPTWVVDGLVKSHCRIPWDRRATTKTRPRRAAPSSSVAGSVVAGRTSESTDPFGTDGLRRQDMRNWNVMLPQVSTSWRLYGTANLEKLDIWEKSQANLWIPQVALVELQCLDDAGWCCGCTAKPITWFWVSFADSRKRCQYSVCLPRRDGQAELTWVTETVCPSKDGHPS